ncbi:unnamed protein product [Lactuca saligna]|uniref:Uncharacterized protein n=1 Tax=Lactuca saligna TaxID=75948 RepID=A0AA36DZC7_LACSI|nr:unnamed protein product [Lactuca saligna]
MLLLSLFHVVLASSKILEGFHKLTPSGFRPLTPEMQATIDATDKPKKRGKGSKKGEKKTAAKKGPSDTAKSSLKKRKAPTSSFIAIPKRRKQPARKRKSPTPSANEGSDFETESKICIEEDQPIHNEEVEHIRKEESPIRNKGETTNHEVNQSFNVSFPSPPPSPKTTSTPITIAPCPPPISSSQQTTISLSTPIFTDSTIPPTTSATPQFQFTYSLFQIRTESEDESTITKWKLNSLHEKNDQLLLASKASSSEAYSNTTVESLFERITKELTTNIVKMNKVVYDYVEVYKTMTEKVNKRISDTTTSMETYQTTHNYYTVSTSSDPKQGGEDVSGNESPKSPVNTIFKKEPKGKEKIIDEEPIIDNEEDEEPNEAELKRWKEAEEKEKDEWEAHATLKSKMLLFPEWTLKRIQPDAEDLPSQYWLDPVASFDLQNSQDSQLDLLITPKEFRFRAFVKVAGALNTDSGANHMMFSFYLKHMKPQYDTWFVNKITVVKV